MNTLEGTYKSNFDKFSIIIEKIANTNSKTEFEFRLLNNDDSEESLYKEEMTFATISNVISVVGRKVKISCPTDFSIISVLEFPRFEYKGNYTRIS